MNTESRLSLLALVFASSACSASSLETDRPDSGRPPDAAPIASSAPPDGGASTAITVTGYAVDKNRPTSRLSGRSVALLDATGRRVALTSDASGAFEASGIVPPYDALVEGGAAGETPIAYLGLSTAAPRIGGWSSEVVCTTRSATIDVPVALPACGSAECHYDVSLSSAGDPLVGGSSGQSYDPSAPPQTMSVQASWCGDASIAVALHVLTSDDAYVRYAYASTTPIDVTDGATATAGMITPLAVPTAGTMTLSVASVGVPQTWGAPKTEILLVYPNGGGVAMLQSFDALYVETGVPDIAGATLTAQSLFRDPVPSDPYAAAMAETRGVALSTRESALTVDGAPVVTSPTSGGAVGITGGMAWTLGATDEVVDATLSTIGGSGDANVVADVFTSGVGIDLARLGALGIVLPLGNASLQLAAAGKVASLDAMIDGNTLATSDGSETSSVVERFAFTP